VNVDRFRVRPSDASALVRHRTDDTGDLEGKDAGRARLEKGLKRLEARQELLYAQDRYAVLLVFQGLDAAGKDSAIKHVMSGVNPQGTEVHSFKRPSDDDLEHDFLWRTTKALPARGRIGIFNRSYYEEVLVVRVHPELIERQRLPPEAVTRRLWRERYDSINAFERHLWRNGTVIRKFFLHVSKRVQRKRLLARLDDPTKNWKFSPDDLRERGKWRDYMQAYRDMLRYTSTRHAPWYVVPADHKWFAHVVIAEIIVQMLDGLELRFPELTPSQRRAIREARKRSGR